MGKWKATKIYCEHAGGGITAMRSRKAKLARMRRLAARNAKPGAVVALESKDDNEGFGFWLAEGVQPAKFHYGESKKVDGVLLEKGNFYITVKIIDRYPTTSTTVFKLEPSQKAWKVNAEGVMLSQVRLEEVVSVNRRKTRSATQSNSNHVRTFELSEEELQRCTEAAAEKLDPAGKEDHCVPDAPDPMRRPIG